MVHLRSVLSVLSLSLALCACAAQVSSDTKATAPGRVTMRTVGRTLLDTCGEPFIARGVEQLAGPKFSADGTLSRLADELIETGSNAVRLLPKIAELDAADLDTLLTRFAAQRVVVYLSPGDRSWFERPSVRRVLMRHEPGLILDAFQEPNYNDVPRWLREAKQAVATLRAAGYVCPLTVLADSYGRNLPAALAHGQEIVDSDPLHNVVIGWQAYWGEGGYYQQLHQLSLEQGVERAGQQTFPMQLGIDLYADPGDVMDYGLVMAVAQREGLGFLWWNFWNRWDSTGNNASQDGTSEHLTAAGRKVLHDDPNAIMRTARKACFR